MNNVVFLRNAPSVWDQEKRFAGWHDVPLSAAGFELARQAGKAIRDSAIRFDLAFTSVLARAIPATTTATGICSARTCPTANHGRRCVRGW